MVKKDELAVAELLATAASEVTPAPDREPWDYGWHISEYRHSNRAALTSPDGPVTMTAAGIDAFDEAILRLLGEKHIRDRWSSDEFWGLVASLVVSASTKTNGQSHFIERNVELLRHGGQSLTLQLIANATWGRAPLILGDAIIGDAGPEFLDFVNANSGKRAEIDEDLSESWLSKQVRPRLGGDDVPAPVAIACWNVGQRQLAVEETERQLRNIVDLALLLERNLAQHKIYRRGDVNRPGIRGP